MTWIRCFLHCACWMCLASYIIAICPVWRRGCLMFPSTPGHSQVSRGPRQLASSVIAACGMSSADWGSNYNSCTNFTFFFWLVYLSVLSWSIADNILCSIRVMFQFLLLLKKKKVVTQNVLFNKRSGKSFILSKLFGFSGTKELYRLKISPLGLQIMPLLVISNFSVCSGCQTCCNGYVAPLH